MYDHNLYILCHTKLYRLRCKGYLASRCFPCVNGFQQLLQCVKFLSGVHQLECGLTPSPCASSFIARRVNLLGDLVLLVNVLAQSVIVCAVPKSVLQRNRSKFFKCHVFSLRLASMDFQHLNAVNGITQIGSVRITSRQINISHAISIRPKNASVKWLI